MRIKGMTSLCSAAVAAIFYAAPARAEDLSMMNSNGGTIEIGLSQGYLYPNYGIDIAPDKTVARTAISYTHDHVTGTFRTFSLLSSGRGYGHRGLGNEQQLELAYHDAAQTRLGTFEYLGSVNYRFINTGHHAGTGDDYIEITAQLGYPVKLIGSLKGTPYIRAVKDIPVGHNNPLFWEMAGIRVSGPFLSNMKFYLDFVSVHNINSTTAVPHKNEWYAEAGVSRPLFGSVVGTLGVTYTQYSRKDMRFEYLPRRDARLDPVSRLRKDWTSPGAKLFGTLSYSF
ncbi:MAG: hypothetical protein JWL88_396 [Parcubacteria group bacterium]|nr:hypothetical protein [Parcubacteria group bacterium]